MADGFVSALILAAGSSKRMGRTKQLLEIDGRPMIAHVVDHAVASGVDEVVVVVGHDAEAVSAAIPDAGERLRTVENPDHATGQASSLRQGLRALNEGSEAVVVLLSDQPGVTGEDIDRVIAAWRELGGIAARASYGVGDERFESHPVLLARAVWKEVEQEEGDRVRATYCGAATPRCDGFRSRERFLRILTLRKIGKWWTDPIARTGS